VPASEQADKIPIANAIAKSFRISIPVVCEAFTLPWLARLVSRSLQQTSRNAAPLFSPPTAMTQHNSREEAAWQT
jgi:hypothetical protein